MNYFELFEIPVQLTIDPGVLKRKYIELTRKFHPDYFIKKNSDEQKNALEISAELNKAYKTLSNKDDALAYVLSLKGLQTKDEKYQLSPDFLMEMMEVNEELAEANMSDDANRKGKSIQNLKKIETDIYEPVKKIIENYNDDTVTEKELLQIKDYYYRKKYLKRLQHQLKEKL